MLKRHHVFFYSFLAVMLALTMGYGISQHLRYQRAARLLEDACQSALTDAAVHLNGLHISLEKLLLTEDAASCAQWLSRISQQAGEAQSRLAEIPLFWQSGGKTGRFLAQTEEYARVLAGLAAGKQSPTDADREQMERMAAQAALLSAQIELMRGRVAAEGLQLSRQFRLSDKTDHDGEYLAGVLNETANDYPTLIYDGAFSDDRATGSPVGLPEGEVTHEQALAIAREFVGPERVTGVAKAPDALGEIPAWGVQVATAEGILNVEVTRQGGKVLWMMPEHGGFESLMTLEECRQKAETFLASRGFDPMIVSDYQVYEGIAVFQFAAVQDGVILYPDQIKVQCRLDTGDVVGLEARHYWMNHAPRRGLSPSLTPEEARGRVSPRLTVTGERLCLIPQNGKERLCYEFAGLWQGGEYRLYLDAHTGEQAELLKIMRDGQGIRTI